MELKDISIRAINPDNKLEINQLVDLFFRVYENRYPIQSVYDHKFWMTHLGERFLSIAVHSGRELIAHIAIRPDKDNSRIVRLDYPICDPAAGSSLPLIIKEVTAVIERQYRRQKWDLVYQFIFGETPLDFMISRQVVESFEVALCPAYFPSNGRCFEVKDTAIPKRTNVLVAQKTLYLKRKRNVNLFVPERHFQITKFLYEPLRLKRTFNLEADSMTVPSAGGSGLETTCYKQTGVTHACISPSFLKDANQAISELSGSKIPVMLLFVDLTDPCCPDFCEKLETSGYRFCGILPAVAGKDSLVYWRERSADFDSGHLYSPRARILESYIQHYDFTAALRCGEDHGRGEYGQMAANL